MAASRKCLARGGQAIGDEAHAVERVGHGRPTQALQAER